MLAATSDKDNSLELVKLTLELIHENHMEQITPRLEEYFIRVIDDARKIKENPSQASENILPESIELALRMAFIKKLYDQVSNITKIDSLTAKVAGEVLELLEPEVVHKDQFALIT